MKDRNFELGDVVVLRSNENIPMTVDTLELNGEIRCIWFMGEELHEKIFKTSSLKRYVPPAPVTNKKLL